MITYLGQFLTSKDHRVLLTFSTDCLKQIGGGFPYHVKKDLSIFMINQTVIEDPVNLMNPKPDKLLYILKIQSII